MFKTWKIAYSLKNTYRVNSILYALKQIPLLKRLLPEGLYRVRGFKILANILSGLWELVTVFLGKALYFLTLVCGIGILYEKVLPREAFLHIFLFLTLIGGYMKTGMFAPTRDKYYAMMLLGMDARLYTLSDYAYTLGKTVVGFLPFTVIFGLARQVPLWVCLVLPFCVAGVKLTVAAYTLRDYEKRGKAFNENKLEKHQWILTLVLLALAYGLPAVGIALPFWASVAVLGVFLPLGILGIQKVRSFDRYREVNQQLLFQMLHQMDEAKTAPQMVSRKAISADTSVTSHKKGMGYLNELFIKRHKKILWRASVKIAAVCALLSCGAVAALLLFPQLRGKVNALVLTFLPYFVFIMYALNRGTGFTQALFVNCDHSLLTYSFYKQPKFVLKLFRIRLWEIMKINALPAAVIGLGLCGVLWASGGTENPLDYGVLVVSILAMSLFFSIHYLTLYYLLQPYNAGTEVKSATYQIAMFATYLVCYSMMQVRLPIPVFGLACIAFCLVYSLVACILVYRLAPKTFRIRP